LSNPCTLQSKPIKTLKPNNKILNQILWLKWSPKSPETFKKSTKKPWKNLLNKKINPTSLILQQAHTKKIPNMKKNLTVISKLKKNPKRKKRKTK
jgi:hypothetical protein